jgi:hypothetical protein
MCSVHFSVFFNLVAKIGRNRQPWDADRKIVAIGCNNFKLKEIKNGKNMK